MLRRKHNKDVMESREDKIFMQYLCTFNSLDSLDSLVTLCAAKANTNSVVAHKSRVYESFISFLLCGQFHSMVKINK